MTEGAAATAGAGAAGPSARCAWRSSGSRPSCWSCSARSWCRGTGFRAGTWSTVPRPEVFSAGADRPGRDVLRRSAAPRLGVPGGLARARAGASASPAAARVAGAPLPGPWWLRCRARRAGPAGGRGAGHSARSAWPSAGTPCDYGLTEQPLAGWFRDQAFSLLVSWVFVGVTVLLVVGTRPALAPAVAAVDRAGRRRADGARLLGLPGGRSSRCSTPSPRCPAGPLRTDILALAAVEHVPINDVLVADASRRTTTLNAYVSGFGSTRRVVLYDNLVRDVPRRETLSVVGRTSSATPAHHDVLDRDGPGCGRRGRWAAACSGCC